MASLQNQIAGFLASSSPTGQRATVGAVFGTAAAALGGVIGGRKGAGIAGLIGGGVGAALGPIVTDFLGGKDLLSQASEQLDVSLGVVPAVEAAIKGETGIQGGVVALARRAATPEARRAILERERARLEASKIEPLFGFLF
jgi:hypothetical protein